MVQVGESYKVHLPGESPWAECMAVNPDGTWYGRIDNELIGSASEERRREVTKHFFPDADFVIPAKHDFKFNDIVRFENTEFGWVPTESQDGNTRQ